MKEGRKEGRREEGREGGREGGRVEGRKEGGRGHTKERTNNLILLPKGQHINEHFIQ